MKAAVSDLTGLRTVELEWNNIQVYGHVEEGGGACYITVTANFCDVWPMLMKSRIEKKFQLRLVLNDVFRELMDKKISAQRISYEATNEENLAENHPSQVCFRVTEAFGKALA